MISPYFIFEITPRCESRCIYCYNVWNQNERYPRGELSFQRIAALFDKLTAEIVPSGVTLAGGEPLMHPEIADVSSFLSKKGIAVGIATSGTLLDDEMTEKLKASGVSHFEISIPSVDIERFRALTGNEKAGSARRALLLAKRSGAKLTVSVVITRLNISDIGEVIDLAAAFSADSVSLNRFVPGGEGIRHFHELMPARDEIEEALSTADAKSGEFGMPVAVTVPIEPCIIGHERFPHLHFGTCCCGREKWVIDPLGNLRTCEQNPVILGSLFEKSFSELAESIEAERFRDDNLKKECGGCSFYPSCGGGCRFLLDGRKKKIRTTLSPLRR